MVTVRSRGQMILLMAVIFAVTVLTAVILLNTLHTPADVNTQSQASSLDDVARIEAQIADDMERLHLVHTSMNRTGEALPYAENETGPDDRFSHVVRNNSDLTAGLTASNSGAVVSVTYVGDRSQEGMLIRQNDSTRNFTHEGYDSSDQNWTVLKTAKGLPRLTMNVTDGPDGHTRPFKMNVSGGTQLAFDSNGVEGSGVDCELEYPIQVDATSGVGTVSNQTEVCGTFDLELPDTFELTFENGSQANGTYTISGVKATGSELETNRFGWQQLHDGVIVNPVFRVQYTDPTITHSSTFALYNGTSP